MNFDKLTKVLMMTTSASDGEALAAIRTANAMLARANTDWREFLEACEKALQYGQQGQAQQQAPNSSRSTSRSASNMSASPEIDAMFTTLSRQRRMSQGFKDFVQDVFDFYQNSGFLTRKQYEAIKKAADRAQWEDVV